MARPMVVGDRLWLFSQSPNAPMHQSLVLPSGPQLRPIIAPQAGNGPHILAGGRPPYYNRHLMSSVPSRLPISTYARGMAGNFNQHLPFDARSLQQSPASSSSTLPLGHHMLKEEYLNYQAKCLPPSAASLSTATTGSGLADLEKAFGSRSELLTRRNYSADCDRASVASSGDRRDAMLPDIGGQRVISDTESDIDCEQVDD